MQTSETIDQPEAGLRARVLRALNGGLTDGGRLSLTNWILITLIIASILFAVFDSEDSVSGSFRSVSHTIELAFGMVFLAEYLARLWTSLDDPRYGGGLKGMLRYAATPAAIIDLLALSPLVFASVGSEAYVLRLLRLLRILRLTKIGRYSRAASLIWRAVRLRRYELGISLLAGIFLMLISAACLYAVEGADQPEKFGSILRAMWWAVSTLTVGYGDVYPVTTLGKVFASLTALIGIGLIAVPTGIIASAFGEVIGTPPAADDPKEGAGPGPDRAVFAEAIAAQLTRAEQQGREHHEINAGELHRLIGGYPGSSNRMPVCCGAMREEMAAGDTVTFQPDGGAGASLTIRYALPRSSGQRQ